MLADPRALAVRKPVGGVAAVMLTSAANIRSILFEQSSNATICTRLIFADRSAVMECPLLEQQSSFTERLATSGGSHLITHTLRLVADRNLAEAWLHPSFANEIAVDGAVALVTLADGRIYVVGLSQRFGDEQPLRIKSLTADSARRLAETPTVELILEAADTDFAAQFLAA